jgi:hypothetical protein
VGEAKKRSPNIKYVVAAATALTAIATAALVIVSGKDSGSDTRADDGGVNFQCTINGEELSGETCKYEASVPDPEETDEAEVRQAAEDFVNTPPNGEGPWPFVVAGSEIGLKVRSTNTREGEQLGGLDELHTAWVICKAVSDFDADPSTGVGPRWYKIGWTQQQPSSGFFESTPTTEQTAWAYAGYLVPSGHNGDVPGCT